MILRSLFLFIGLGETALDYPLQSENRRSLFKERLFSDVPIEKVRFVGIPFCGTQKKVSGYVKLVVKAVCGGAEMPVWTVRISNMTVLQTIGLFCINCN